MACSGVAESVGELGSRWLWGDRPARSGKGRRPLDSWSGLDHMTNCNDHVQIVYQKISIPIKWESTINYFSKKIREFIYIFQYFREWNTSSKCLLISHGTCHMNIHIVISKQYTPRWMTTSIFRTESHGYTWRDAWDLSKCSKQICIAVISDLGSNKKESHWISSPTGFNDQTIAGKQGYEFHH